MFKKQTAQNACNIFIKLLKKGRNVINMKPVQNCSEFIDRDKLIFEHQILDFFLSTNFNMCFGYSKEPSH